jgi:hypothetical protein
MMSFQRSFDTTWCAQIMVTSYDIQAIAETLSCPVQWESICSDREFAAQLRFMWVFAVSLHQVDGEAALMHNDLAVDAEPWMPDLQTIELLHDDDESVRARLVNAKTWRPRAEKRYCAATKRFEKLLIATSEIYKKHYAGRRLSDKEVAAQSLTSPDGMLYPRCDAEWQRSLAWAALSREWYVILCGLQDSDDTAERGEAFEKRFGDNATSILVQLDYDLGCARGRGTPYALIKFDFSSPYLAHVYPCFRADYERNHAVRYIPYEELDAPTEN